MMSLNRMLPIIESDGWILPVPVPTLRAGALLSVKASGTESRGRDMLRSNMRRFRHTKFEIVGHALHRNGLPVRQSDAGPLAWEDDPDVCTSCGAEFGFEHAEDCEREPEEGAYI